MATNAKYKIFNGTSWEEIIFPVGDHTHSEYAPKASPTFTGTIDTSSGTLKIRTINAPTSSGGTTYGPGTNGYVLKSRKNCSRYINKFNTNINRWEICNEYNNVCDINIW